jgi:uncharacterized lipoprotein YmbA
VYNRLLPALAAAFTGPLPFAAASAIAMALAGCGAVPTQSYYVLTPLAASAQSNAAAAQSGISIFVEQAHVPEAVDRPQLVIGAGENRVTILEQQRWAEPLRAAIPQVIALDLARLIDGARVTTAQQIAFPDDAWRLSLDVQRFESRPGDAVAIEIAWTLRRGSADAKTGRSIAREAIAGSGYDAIAIAHSKALAAISREIASALRAVASEPRKPAL